MPIEMTISQARTRLGDVLDTARVQRQPVFLTRHGKRVGVIQGIEQWSQPEEPAAAEDALRRQIAEISKRAQTSIKPGTPPLIDPRAFYETREPRL